MARRGGTTAAPTQAGAVRRCAIYTRKSSEEGLEQDFNSLHAQREACEAFVASQRHEGWRLLPAHYDDGGISGGTLERPALKQLLADIRERHVDLVVVYKVDRLTRSLADFAKIVDVFDAHNASFVSVTQQFNTATSMGRLTLNMLLSFAQFEREVTGERIRDKIAASKRKGMWMGGLPPLGYDVRDRKLAVNEPEADTVRHIFRSYLTLGSVRALKGQLDREGVITKVRPSHDGKAKGGLPLSRGNLYHMLANRLYLGEVAHANAVYPGEHAAIVSRDLWDQVQSQLGQPDRAPCETGRAKHPSLLAGLAHDATGARLVATHAVARGRRYRYYVSERLISGKRTNVEQAWRLPAADLERLVIDRLLQLLGSASEMAAVLAADAVAAVEATRQPALIAQAADLARRWRSQSMAEQQQRLTTIIKYVNVHPDRVEIELRPGVLGRPMSATALNATNAAADSKQTHASADQHDSESRNYRLIVPARLRRAGLEMRLVIDGSGHPANTDITLIRLIARSHRMRATLIEAPNSSLTELADAEGVTTSYFTRVMRLAFLAPDITRAILDGRQSPELTAATLLHYGRLPLAWDEQRTVLGFG